MHLITIILLIGTASLIRSTTLDTSNSCKCSELIYTIDCLSSFSGCDLDTHTIQCVDLPCSNIQFQNYCTYSSMRCYWFNDLCHDFTSCEAITGKNQTECIQANIYCPASNGINCLPMEYQQKCSDIKDPNTCNDYYSPEGKCMWKDKNCIILQSCTQLWTNTTQTCWAGFCYFDALSYKCKDITCSNLPIQSICNQGVNTIGPYLNNTIPCAWDTNTGQCKEANPDDFSADDCYYHSAGTYHWSNSKSSKGSCVPCQSSIFYISIGLIMIIM